MATERFRVCWPKRNNRVLHGIPHFHLVYHEPIPQVKNRYRIGNRRQTVRAIQRWNLRERALYAPPQFESPYDVLDELLCRFVIVFIWIPNPTTESPAFQNAKRLEPIPNFMINSVSFSLEALNPLLTQNRNKASCFELPFYACF